MKSQDVSFLSFHVPHPGYCLRITFPVCLVFLLIGGWAAAEKASINICHVPDNDPTLAHTILISERALTAHLGHGDTLGPCGSDLLCGEGITPCDGSCRDLRTDEAHCGACGYSCGEGETCQNGACVAFCEEPPGPCGDGFCGIAESCSSCPVDCLLPEEICDGRDNDCDGEIDEGLQCDNCPCVESVEWIAIIDEGTSCGISPSQTQFWYWMRSSSTPGLAFTGYDEISPYCALISSSVSFSIDISAAALAACNQLIVDTASARGFECPAVEPY